MGHCLEAATVLSKEGIECEVSYMWDGYEGDKVNTLVAYKVFILGSCHRGPVVNESD